jgi:hypothetical protein
MREILEPHRDIWNSVDLGQRQSRIPLYLQTRRASIGESGKGQKPELP